MEMNSANNLNELGNEFFSSHVPRCKYSSVITLIAIFWDPVKPRLDSWSTKTVR